MARRQPWASARSTDRRRPGRPVPSIPYLALCVVATAGVAEVAQAQESDNPGKGPEKTCDLRLSGLDREALVWRGDLNRGYDPFGSNRHVERFTFFVAGEAERACPFALTLSTAKTGGETTLRRAEGGNELRFRIARRPQRSSENILATSAFGARSRERLTGVLPAGRSRTRVTLYMTVDHTGGPLAQGTYTRDVRFTLSERNRKRILDEATLTAGAVVPASVDLALKTADFTGPPSPAELDLGELDRDRETQASLDVFVRANVRFTVKARSINAGRLVRLGPETGPGFRIPYEVEFARQGRSRLSDSFEQVFVGRPTARKGQAIDMTVTAPPSPGYAAGDYRDTVVISVSPNL